VIMQARTLRAQPSWNPSGTTAAAIICHGSLKSLTLIGTERPQTTARDP
jgi:hypothetical protein